MRETLIVIGLVVLAVALRSARGNCIRKVGAITFLFASFCLFYFISSSLLIGCIGALLWFFLPWVELLTRIRRHPRLCNVSVVIISSSVEESDIRRAYGRGANSYVTKPVDNRALQSLYASVANYWTLTNIACPETAG